MSDRRPRVLAIDDEPAMNELVSGLLSGLGYEVETAVAGQPGRERFEAFRPDVVIVDMMLPDGDGLALLKEFKSTRPEAEVIVLTAHATVARAVEAIQSGAHNFLEKPIDPDALQTYVERALERRRLREENVALRRQLEDRFQYGNIIGGSRKVHEALDLVRSVAASDANVLIVGENGTGKELFANALHANSKRAGGPFIKINCAAIPKDLIESELFGYRKGAFTGALADREGLFEMAEGGSLLLDEIGEMPTYLQTKLLRVLQEREYRPIGSDRIVRVDFRLVCATNADIAAARQEGRFREDLFFRINTITLRVPPLRERPEDIPLLCEHFLARYRERHQRNVRAIAPDAHQLLAKHPWPGNVRELENAIERGVLVAKGDEILVSDLPESLREETMAGADADSLPANRTLAQIEKLVIERTLERTGWNKQETAQVLGLYRPTLYSKMKKYEIRDPKQQRRRSAERARV